MSGRRLITPLGGVPVTEKFRMHPPSAFDLSTQELNTDLDHVPVKGKILFLQHVRSPEDNVAVLTVLAPPLPRLPPTVQRHEHLG